MSQIIFNRWTLKFHNVSHEILYENEQNETRLFTFRVLTGCLSIVGFACLITFVAQLQTGMLVYEMAFMLTFNSLLLICSKRLVPYLKYVFTIMFALFVVTSNLINSTGELVPHYLYGYSTCLLLMCTVQQSNYQIRILFVVAVPLIQMGLYQAYDIDQMQYVFFTFTGTILAALLTYKIEYNRRVSFQFQLIANRYKEMIDSITTDAIFWVIFNERTNQLELKFFNKKLEDIFQIIDSEKMREFLRNAFIIPKSEEWKFQDQIFKKNSQKSTSLEDFLFFKIKHKQTKEWKENTVQIGVTRKSELIKYQFQMKYFDLGEPIIICQIQSNKVPELIEKQEEQMKSFNNAIVVLSSSLAEQQQKLFEDLQNIQCKCVKKSKIRQIQCSTFAIVNQMKNVLVFFQQEKIAFLKQSIEVCIFEHIIEILKPYLENRSNQYQRQFQLNQSIYSILELKINTRILIQITINIFEHILKMSAQHSKIILNIYLEKNLNPQEQGNTSSVDIKQSSIIIQKEQLSIQKLLKFTFQFYSTSKVNLEPTLQMMDHKNWTNFNNLDAQINYPVTCILLSLIGPYNNTRTSQIPLNNQQFLNTISFYFYVDQSELDQSFIKFIKKGQRFLI